MNTDLMFSSKSAEWSTPQHLFNQLDEMFHFNLDVCATAENAKCKKFFTREDDALKKNWKGVCWMNPPYGRQLKLWMKKAYEQSLIWSSTVVCLIPARTDTHYWHTYCSRAREICFIKGRLKFGDCKNSAPFPSAIVVFGPSAAQAMKG